jgi:hypothetical protein
VQLLKDFGVKFCAVPNGHVRSSRQHIQAAQEGVSKGMVDLLIFTPPPALYGKVYAVGTALEMKRANAKSRDVRREQRVWLRDLAALGWVPLVGYGAGDAIAQLQALGYFPGLDLNSRAITATTTHRTSRLAALIESGVPTASYIAPRKPDGTEPDDVL